jgi:hypothetical protein
VGTALLFLFLSLFVVGSAGVLVFALVLAVYASRRTRIPDFSGFDVDALDLPDPGDAAGVHPHSGHHAHHFDFGHHGGGFDAGGHGHH